MGTLQGLREQPQTWALRPRGWGSWAGLNWGRSWERCPGKPGKELAALPEGLSPPGGLEEGLAWVRGPGCHWPLCHERRPQILHLQNDWTRGTQAPTRCDRSKSLITCGFGMPQTKSNMGGGGESEAPEMLS